MVYSVFHQCRCEPGFRLKNDGKTCMDVDECTTTYPCSQRCVNSYGSFHCFCVEGYAVHANDSTRCKSSSGISRTKHAHTHTPLHFFTYILKWVRSANCLVWMFLCVEEEAYLLFANRYYLRKLNLDGSNYTLIKQVSASDIKTSLWSLCS